MTPTMQRDLFDAETVPSTQSTGLFADVVFDRPLDHAFSYAVPEHLRAAIGVGKRVTAPFGRAGYLNNPPPAYPGLAARNGWQGTVLLKVRVLSNGRVETVEVARSSGFKLLDEEAKTTVRTWQFTPSMRGTTAIDGWATVPIEFKLDT